MDNSVVITEGVYVLKSTDKFIEGEAITDLNRLKELQKQFKDLGEVFIPEQEFIKLVNMKGYEIADHSE